MSPPQAHAQKELPPWLIRGASAIIVLHFLAIGSLVLSAQSGPWPTRFGNSPAEGPPFAGMVHRKVFAPLYLEPLHLSNNYHFRDNGPLESVSAVYFEANLKDASGRIVKTVKFPGDQDNTWLRHRYNLLALGLGNDQPLQVLRGEVLAGEGGTMPQVTFWDDSNPKLWKLVTKDEHLARAEQLARKDRSLVAPSEWSLLLARSYQRFLCRHYDVAAVELVRHHKNPVLPAFMFLPEPPQGTFDELICSFGDYRREN
jgi:hypothetical protein